MRLVSSGLPDDDDYVPWAVWEMPDGRYLHVIWHCWAKSYRFGLLEWAIAHHYQPSGFVDDECMLPIIRGIETEWCSPTPKPLVSDDTFKSLPVWTTIVEEQAKLIDLGLWYRDHQDELRMEELL